MTDIPNINDNQCFKWYLIRYIHPGDKNLEKIRKVGEGLARELDFKDMTFPVKKKTFVSALVFLVMKKNIQSVCQKILK